MAAPGTYRNPTERYCWDLCFSCNRCKNKNKYDHCKSCSGRYDPLGKTDPHPDDYCDCTQGNLRWRTQQGKLVQVRFHSNPFKGKVNYQKKTEDERDWESYVNDMREKMNDPTFNPITVVED